MRIFCHLASLTKSWNGPVQLLPMGTSLTLQATPHWKNKWTTHSPILLMDGGALKSKSLRSSFNQMRLDQTSQWQCRTLRIPLELFAKSLRDPQVMKDFVLFSPEEIYWLWIICVRQDYFSCLVLWSIQQFTCHWKWNALEPAWVFIYWYRTLWWFFQYWPFVWWRTQSILSSKLY